MSDGQHRRGPHSTAVPARGSAAAEKGFYARVWVRSRDGEWKVTLDVLQPQ